MLTDDEIDAINDSWVLALQSAGVDAAIIQECKLTVEDFIVNNLGED